MIHSGWNILKFVKAAKNEDAQVGGIPCTAYEFHAINLAYEEVAFAYVVPLGRQRGQIIKDLEDITVKKIWIDVNLIERNRVLLIANMREAKQPQEEFLVRRKPQ